VSADVLPDTVRLPDADWLCPEGDIGEACGGQMTEGSTTRLPWSSKMALDILRELFSANKTGFEEMHPTFRIRKTLHSC